MATAFCILSPVFCLLSPEFLSIRPSCPRNYFGLTLSASRPAWPEKAFIGRDLGDATAHRLCMRR